MMTRSSNIIMYSSEEAMGEESAKKASSAPGALRRPTPEEPPKEDEGGGGDGDETPTPASSSSSSSSTDASRCEGGLDAGCVEGGSHPPPGALPKNAGIEAPPPPPTPSPAESGGGAYYDGELALSILNASPRDAATGRRASTVAPPRIGAVASKSDPKDDELKKIKEAERARAMKQRGESSTFEERLRRKLDESRSPGVVSGTGSPRRKSRALSMASTSSGLSAFDSIDEGQQANFDLDGSVSGGVGCLKSPPEALAPSSPTPGTNVVGNAEPYPKRYSKTCSPASSRSSSRASLTAEEYQDFILQKIASRGDVGMTYSERKRLEEEAAGVSGGTPSAEAAANSAADGPLGQLSMPILADDDDGEDSKPPMLHHTLGAADHIVGRFVESAPAVEDAEEEKVELSSEDDQAAALECAATASEDEKHGYSNYRPKSAAASGGSPKSPPRYVDGKASLANPRLARGGGGDGSPFSSMVAERKKLDPNDADVARVVPQDDAPEALSAVVTAAHRDSFGDRFWPPDRSLSENAAEPDGAHGSEAVRRGTYALGAGDDNKEERRSSALRELADMVEAQDVVEATLVDDMDPIETVEAIPMESKDEEDPTERRKRKFRKQVVLIWCPLFLLVIVFGVSMSVIESRKGGTGDDGGEEKPRKGGGKPTLYGRVHDPTLVQIRRQGFLRCGVPDKYGFASINDATGDWEGMSADLCRAVAAAVLGDEYEVKWVEVTALTRFTALARREIDLLLFGDTHTMERDFHEPKSGVGFQFTDPYLYDGLGFAGRPHAVQCADNFDWLGECSDVKICVNAGTTHVPILKDIFPSPNIIPRDTREGFLQEFISGGCNVLAGELNDVSEVGVRHAGYSGEFTSGTKTLSKEPLAMVTRKNDQTWSDAANWVLRGLIHAEMHNITKGNADKFAHDHHGRADGPIDLSSAIKAVGNYGDIYARSMQEVVPRKGLNRLYTADENSESGLHYSHPVGSIDAFRRRFAPNGKINLILGRGRLICGVIGDENQSMETDYCRALSASLFSSDTDRVDIVKVSSEDDLVKKLDTGEVDVIAGVSVDFHTDIFPSNDAEAGFSGLAFSQPYFYRRDSGSDLFHHGSPDPKAIATSQIDSDWSTFVYWVVTNLIWAEENGITSSDFREVPDVKIFGEEFEWMFRGSILGIGNYGEVYERNSNSLPPRNKENLLNDGSSPQLWHPQF